MNHSAPCRRIAHKGAPPPSPGKGRWGAVHPVPLAAPGLIMQQPARRPPPNSFPVLFSFRQDCPPPHPGLWLNAAWKNMATTPLLTLGPHLPGQRPLCLRAQQDMRVGVGGGGRGMHACALHLRFSETLCASQILTVQTGNKCNRIFISTKGVTCVERQDPTAEGQSPAAAEAP